MFSLHLERLKGHNQQLVRVRLTLSPHVLLPEAVFFSAVKETMLTVNYGAILQQKT